MKFNLSLQWVMLLGGFFNGAKALQAQKLIYNKDEIEYIISVGV